MRDVSPTPSGEASAHDGLPNRNGQALTKPQAAADPAAPCPVSGETGILYSTHEVHDDRIRALEAELAEYRENYPVVWKDRAEWKARAEAAEKETKAVREFYDEALSKKEAKLAEAWKLCRDECLFQGHCIDRAEARRA